MDSSRLYYFNNRPDGLGLNAGSSPFEGAVPVYFLSKKDHEKLLTEAAKKIEDQWKAIKIDIEKDILLCEEDIKKIKEMIDGSTFEEPEEKEELESLKADITTLENALEQKKKEISIAEENINACNSEPTQSFIPADTLVISKEVYDDLCSVPGDYKLKNNQISKITDSEKETAEQNRLQKIEDERNKPDNIRRERKNEFQIFDKYQLPFLQETLTEAQKLEYEEWRETWLNAPETKKRPGRPVWFKEI